MNVYEQAHALKSAIKESNEYIEFKESEEKLNTNPELAKAMKDFQAKQIEFQTKQMLGENMGSETMEAIQSLSAVMMKDPLAAEYLQRQMRFSVMIKDVYDVLNEVIGINI